MSNGPNIYSERPRLRAMCQKLGRLGKSRELLMARPGYSS